MFLGAIKLISIATGVLTSLFLASMMGKNDFGQLSALISLFSVCLVFSNIGISFSVVDIFPKLTANRDMFFVIKKINIYSLVTSLLVGGVAFSYAKYIELIDSTQWYVLVIFVAIILAQNFHSSNIAILRSLQSYKSALIAESLLFNIALVSFIYFLYIHLQFAIYIPLLISVLLSLSISFISSRNKIYSLPENENQAIEPLNSKSEGFNLKKLLPFFLLGVVEVITTNLDTLIINQFFGNAETANYFIAKKTLIVFTFFWFIYNFIYAPKLSRVFSNSIEDVDKESVVRILKMKWPILGVSMIVALSLSFYFKAIMGLIGLPEYAEAQDYIIGFAVFAMIHIVTGPVISFLNVTGMGQYSFKVVGVGAAVFLLVFYPLIVHLGPIGMVVALNLSLISWKICGIVLIKNKTGFNLFVGSYKK